MLMQIKIKTIRVQGKLNTCDVKPQVQHSQCPVYRNIVKELFPIYLTYCFSQLLLQETPYTDPLNFQYPFRSIEQSLLTALRCHLRCCLEGSKCIGSVIVHVVHLKTDSQGKEEFCPMCRCQQRNKRGLSCELETEQNKTKTENVH